MDQSEAVIWWGGWPRQKNKKSSCKSRQ